MIDIKFTYNLPIHIENKKYETALFFGHLNGIFGNTDSDGRFTVFQDPYDVLVTLVSGNTKIWFVVCTEEEKLYVNGILKSTLFQKLVERKIKVNIQKTYPYILDIIIDTKSLIKNNVRITVANDNDKAFKEINKRKFDVCLMNPPYGTTGGDDIHYKFTENCINLCDNIICVMPYALVDKSTKPNPEWRKKLSPNIVEIERINSNIFFGTDQTDVGIYTFIGNKVLNSKDNTYLHTEHIKLVDLTGNIRYCSELTITPFNTYELQFVNFLENDTSNVINFGYLSHENTYVNSYIKKNNIVLDASNENIIKDIVRQERIRKESEKLPKGKVAIICNFYEGSNKTGFHAKYIGDVTGRIITKHSDIQVFLNETKTTSGYNLICCDDILSAENCKIAIQNPLLRFCLSKIQVDRCMQPAVCYRYIPNIDWSDPRVVTDEGLLEVCGCPKDKCKEYAEYCRKYMEEFDKQHQSKKNKKK